MNHLAGGDTLEIVYVGTLPPHPGGSAIIGYQLLEGFVRHGHGVRAIAPITPDIEDTFSIAHPEIPISRVVLPNFEIPPNFPYSSASIAFEKKGITRQLKKLIRQNQPDVIVIGRETYARYVTELARTCDLPCLLVIHGGLTHGIIDGSHSPELSRRLLSEYRKAEMLVTPAEHMATSLRRLSLDVTVIPNGLDLALFSPVPRRAKEVVVTFSGHLRPLKRPLDFVLAAELALQQDPRLKFVVIGDGPLRDMMEVTCREKGIEDRFQFTGWVSHTDIPSWLKASDIVVTPTQIENQSLTHLEAQACGLLLIASNIPAAREVITDGVTGLLFELGDVDDLARKILLGVADVRMRRQIGRNARVAAEKHSMEHSVLHYISVMQEVVHRHSTKAYT